MGRQSKRQCLNIATQALQGLLPPLFQCLTKQSEELDDDTWIPAMAAGTCLGLLAECTGDAILAPVLKFVEGNLKHSEW